MPKKQFKATEGLLNDVMRKQAGSVEKAVLEGVMNSVDAGADNIAVDIKVSGMTISDDGKGMTEEEIDEYFEKFGLKDDDIEDKEFGKFRMGRGQIFNFGKNVWHTNDNLLIVNLEEENTVVSMKGVDDVFDTEGLSYFIEKTEQTYDGCEVSVEFYNPLDSVDSKVKAIKELIEFIPWLHDVSITINGDVVTKECVFDEKTENAYFLFEPEGSVGKLPTYRTETAVYNKGAFVKTESLAPIDSVIVTEKDLEVNFARNDILEHDEMWQDIKDEFVERAQSYLVEKRNLTTKESKWLLTRALDDEGLAMALRDIPIIEDIDGNKHTLEELSGEDISFTHSSNKMAKDLAEQTGVLFISDEYEDYLEGLISESKFYDYEDVVDRGDTFEMNYIPADDLSKKRRDRLAMARWFLLEVGFTGDVEAGYSKNANVWKDSDNTLFIHKGLLNEKKETFLTEGLDEMIEVAAHRDSTMQGRSHNHSFKRQYWRLSKNRAKAVKKLRNGTANYEHY